MEKTGTHRYSWVPQIVDPFLESWKIPCAELKMIGGTKYKTLWRRC